MQRRPAIARAFINLNMAVMANKGRVTSDLKRLIGYLTSRVAASTIPNGVDAALQARVREHWDEGEIVEMMGVIALFGYLNRWNDSMATTLEEGAEESGRQWLTGDGWERGKHA